MTIHASEFIGEGWSAVVTASEASIEVRLLLIGVAASGMAVLTLPVRHHAEAMKAMTNVLFADEMLLAAAVDVHLGQHPVPRAGRRSTSEPLQFAGAAQVLSTRSVKSSKAKQATLSVKPPCARHRR